MFNTNEKFTIVIFLCNDRFNHTNFVRKTKMIDETNDLEWIQDLFDELEDPSEEDRLRACALLSVSVNLK
jgi:hypothetical protein